MPLRIFIVHTTYPEFLNNLYARHPDLAGLDFESQRDRYFATFFGPGDAYSYGLKRLGCETTDVVCNADIMQRRWADGRALTLIGNIHDQRRQIVAAQIRDFRPDVLYVSEWNPLADTFLTEMKAHTRLLLGQIGSALRPNRTYDAYDLMLSSLPPIVDFFQKNGGRGVYMPLAFDERVLEHVPDGVSRFDVTFVGGFSPVHPDRVEWIEDMMEAFDVDVFGYGIEHASPDSPVCKRHHGESWGLDMYRVLRDSRITFNRHAHTEVRGRTVSEFANNLRLFEATGVGTCLFTEDHANLSDMFEPGHEVVAYRDKKDCIEKLRHFLTQEPARKAIAAAGLARTMRDHRYTQRMEQLLELLLHRLNKKQIIPPKSHALPEIADECVIPQTSIDETEQRGGASCAAR